MVVVIEAPSPELIKAALDDLGSQLGREPENFSDVLYKVDLRELQNKRPAIFISRTIQYLHNGLAGIRPHSEGSLEPVEFEPHLSGIAISIRASGENA